MKNCNLSIIACWNENYCLPLSRKYKCIYTRDSSCEKYRETLCVRGVELNYSASKTRSPLAKKKKKKIVFFSTFSCGKFNL